MDLSVIKYFLIIFETMVCFSYAIYRGSCKENYSMKSGNDRTRYLSFEKGLDSIELKRKADPILPVLPPQNAKTLKDIYMKNRHTLIENEQNMFTGNAIVLTERERKVNDTLMKLKRQEIDRSFGKVSLFAPSVHFFHGKSLIDKSEVFKFIKKMPKGASLHLHDASTVNIDWVVKNITYRDHAYMCRDKINSLFFHFFDNAPHNPECPWESMRSARTSSNDVTAFDDMIYNSLSMATEHPEIAYPSNHIAWIKFGHYFEAMDGLISYREVYPDYIREALREFYQDNVQYIEMRTSISRTYELNGTVNDQSMTMSLFQQVIASFKADHPDFSGAKLILDGGRQSGKTQILKDVKNSLEYMKRFPDIFAGYDISGQEDLGKPLIYYIDELLYPLGLDPPVKLPYFFHVAETGFQGAFSDQDLYEAILLNVTRIGHGFQITKHPELMRILKERNIPVEFQPISNQVLKLVDDLRNHPGAVLLADGHPVVISSDDVAVWNATGLSYDIYMAFMAMTPRDADLRVLKQLAINSLQYSTMSDTEKRKALDLWRHKWDVFIGDIMTSFTP